MSKVVKILLEDEEGKQIDITDLPTEKYEEFLEYMVKLRALYHKRKFEYIKSN
jgi:hypothetical protein